MPTANSRTRNTRTMRTATPKKKTSVKTPTSKVERVVEVAVKIPVKLYDRYGEATTRDQLTAPAPSNIMRFREINDEIEVYAPCGAIVAVFDKALFLEAANLIKKGG